MKLSRCAGIVKQLDRHRTEARLQRDAGEPVFRSASGLARCASGKEQGECTRPKGQFQFLHGLILPDQFTTIAHASAPQIVSNSKRIAVGLHDVPNIGNSRHPCCTPPGRHRCGIAPRCGGRVPHSPPRRRPSGPICPSPECPPTLVKHHIRFHLIEQPRPVRVKQLQVMTVIDAIGQAHVQGHWPPCASDSSQRRASKT